jgi:hypothetical protein
LKIDFKNGLIKRPRSFLDAAMRDNATWFAARSVTTATR